MPTKSNNPAAEIDTDPGVKLPDKKVVKILSRRHLGSPKPSVAPPDDWDDPGPAAA